MLRMKIKKDIEDIKEILVRIKEVLKDSYGERLKDVILYGSFVNNNATEDSDIDIAAVLKGKVDKTKEIDRIYELLYDLILETGELISVYPVSEKEINNIVWPLYKHIKTMGLKI
jgi:predicted nucleotidyltransferase